MKLSTQIAAALLTLGIVSHAGATDPVVYLTGSTAFRSTVFLALSGSTPTNNPSNLFDSNTVSYVTYGNSAANKGNYMVFHGNIGGNPVYVNCAWSGSEAGIASACNATLTNYDNNGNPIALNGSPAAWLDVTKVSLINGVASSSNPSSSLMENGGVPFHGADLSQADTSQSISWTPSVPSVPATQLVNFGGNAVQGECVVTFAWSRNKNSSPTSDWLSCTNVTLPEINTLLGAGRLPASYFTGNPSHTNYVYLVGRNLGSGTRMNALGDPGYGAHTAVQQFSIGEGIEIAATGTLLLDYERNNGYESGGGVATAMAIDGSCQQADPFSSNPGWFALCYAGPSDLNGVGLTSSSTWVTVDGVLPSNGAIENGQYWYWGYEHLYGKNGISGTPQVVGNQLYSATVSALASLGYGTNSAILDPGIPLSRMKVSKSSDVAFPSP